MSYYFETIHSLPEAGRGGSLQEPLRGRLQGVIRIISNCCLKPVYSAGAGQRKFKKER